jgi:hypothetical protein
MAYQQSPGRSPLEKTGRGIAPLMQQVAGTKSFSEKNPNAFKAKELPEMKLSVPNIAANASAESNLRANSDQMDVARYDLAAKNNSSSVKADLFASKAYGKGSAKAGDTSAETITLKQNQGQLPGEKGFKGGTSERGTAIFPTVKGDKVSGEIPKNMQWNQGPDEEYAGNTNKQYWKSDKPGALGKLETLGTGFTGGGKTPRTSDSVTNESFGAIDKFNEVMGGARNSTKIGRDTQSYGAGLLGDKTRANTLEGSSASGSLRGVNPLSDADYQREAIDRSTSYDLSKGRGTLAREGIYNNPQGQEAVRSNDTATLYSMAKRAGTGEGERGQTAAGYLKRNIKLNTNSDPNKGGYESTYKQKYDYPTDVNYNNNTKNAQGETEIGEKTYSGPKSGAGYFSPESTMAQNTAAATAADSNVGLKDYLTKGKSKYFKM